MIDAILYDWFPDRLPGELDDTLDLVRFFRMVQAKNVMNAEDERKTWLDGGSKAPDAKAPKASKRRHAEMVKTWAEHDRLLAEFGFQASDE